MWRKGNTFVLFVGMQTGATAVENNMEIPQKIKNGTAFWPSNPTSGNITEETQDTNSKEQETPIFIAVLFTIAKTWKPPKYPSVDEWTKQLCDIYTMEYYSAIYIYFLPFVTASTDLQNIILSEISQSEKDKDHMISLICGI